MPLEFRKNQYLFKDYLKKRNFAGLFRDYYPKIKAFESFPYSLITIFLIFFKIIFGEKIRNNISIYFDYFSRYGHHYHFFGLKEFLQKRKKN